MKMQVFLLMMLVTMVVACSRSSNKDDTTEVEKLKEEIEDIRLTTCKLLSRISTEDTEANGNEKNGTKQGAFRIKYTVENLITGDDREFKASMMMRTTSRPFYEIMLEAAQKNSTFRFESKEYPDLGQYISSINGLAANVTQKTFWAFMKRGCYECLLQVGVSTYKPGPGDHMVFAFETYDIFNKIPNCP